MAAPPANVPFAGGGLVTHHTGFSVSASDLTDEDTSQSFVDDYTFPAGARLLNSWVGRTAMVGPAVLSPARIQGATGPTFALVGGQTFVATVSGSPGTVTFNDGTYGYFEPTADEPYNMGDLAWYVRINGGAEETVNFVSGDFAVPAAATAAEVITRLNTHFAGRAVATPSGNKWRLTSNMIGIRSGFISNGGFVPWAFDFGGVGGTGTSVDVTATTLLEVKNAVEHTWSGAVVLDITGGDLDLSTVGSGSSQSINIQAHTAAALGFDVGETFGTDATTAHADFGVTGATDCLGDGMDLLTSGDGPGSGSNAVPAGAIPLGGKSLRVTVVSNGNVADLAGGGGAATVHVIWTTEG